MHHRHALAKKQIIICPWSCPPSISLSSKFQFLLSGLFLVGFRPQRQEHAAEGARRGGAVRARRQGVGRADDLRHIGAERKLRVGLALFKTIFCSKDTQLNRYSMVHVNDLTLGSVCNPTFAGWCPKGLSSSACMLSKP